MQLQSFQVVPAIPERLKGLRELAYNLLWSWDEDVRTIFTRVDRELWDATYQNPTLMLGLVSQGRLEELASDEGFLAFYDRTLERLRTYLGEHTYWEKRYATKPLIAYFSAEFGLAECLPIYSGGLGVLSGHHLKSASDLGVPLVGVGLAYQQGYFRQYLTSDGWQQERYPVNDFYNLPVQPVTAEGGAPLRVELNLAGQRVLVQAWKVQVGRLPLVLLDTNLPENSREAQEITDQLYGGGIETRIRQEIVLGMGGFRMLRAMDLDPVVCHLNEGHSAFSALERIRQLVLEGGLRFAEALEAVRAGTVFTTHTPVPAGFDAFPPELVEKYFGQYLAEVDIDLRTLLDLGRAAGDEALNMAALALRTAAFVNGVSALHGEVSRSLLQKYMPSIPEPEVPVAHVTNGAHTRSSVSREMAQLFDRYLGPDWWQRPGLADSWEAVDTIPDEELWATHERRRERLVAFARRRLAHQIEQRGASQRDLERARGVLDTRALTIGFSRRFATYKRASLILHDLDRLRRILLDSARPVQVIFAGKAHPRDNEAKEMLKAVVAFCQRDDVRRHAVFLEDYDLVVARYLVQGCDVWLNTPRRGMEASGTSGMKVLPNGGLNLSTLDGWWAEAFQPEVGWAIGKGETYVDHAYQDDVESGALYDLLEHEIAPLFYSRGVDGLPRAWISRMKASMRRLTHAYSTNRMVLEYADRFYLPAAAYHARLTADGCARARRLAEWKRGVALGWREVRIESVEAVRQAIHSVGEGFGVRAAVHLGPLTPADVAVEVYHGALDAHRRIARPQTLRLRLVGNHDDGLHRYQGVIGCERSGMQGYTVRVRPEHPDANNFLSTGLMTWWAD